MLEKVIGMSGAGDFETGAMIFVRRTEGQQIVCFLRKRTVGPEDNGKVFA
ncbi:hypothetical protein LZ24_01689 [Desulfobotulus alkaliphilus]|uniref:Uncharacterized protein n=1 Tax=Desulfobotulus alkaliphilus TaxID=622671 RepID=A0A562RT74_9BACT|nr:hypothetical protein [Desulfobotulus alkaliphilus]TWI72281.1 hypothetical protein LZ24_01689 [Desulfobotulus alkaliphilus]